MAIASPTIEGGFRSPAAESAAKPQLGEKPQGPSLREKAANSRLGLAIQRAFGRNPKSPEATLQAVASGQLQKEATVSPSTSEQVQSPLDSMLAAYKKGPTEEMRQQLLAKGYTDSELQFVQNEVSSGTEVLERPTDTGGQVDFPRSLPPTEPRQEDDDAQLAGAKRDVENQLAEPDDRNIPPFLKKGYAGGDTSAVVTSSPPADRPAFVDRIVARNAELDAEASARKAAETVNTVSAPEPGTQSLPPVTETVQGDPAENLRRIAEEMGEGIRDVREKATAAGILPQERQSASGSSRPPVETREPKDQRPVNFISPASATAEVSPRNSEAANSSDEYFNFIGEEAARPGQQTEAILAERQGIVGEPVPVSTTEAGIKIDIPNDLKEDPEFLARLKSEAIANGKIDVDLVVAAHRAGQQMNGLFNAWGTTEGSLTPRKLAENESPSETHESTQKAYDALTAAEQDPEFDALYQETLHELSAKGGGQENRRTLRIEAYKKYVQKKTSEQMAQRADKSVIAIPADLRGDQVFINAVVDAVIKDGKVDIAQLEESRRDTLAQEEARKAQEAAEQAEAKRKADEEEALVQQKAEEARKAQELRNKYGPKAEEWADKIVRELIDERDLNPKSETDDYDYIAITQTPEYQQIYKQVDLEAQALHRDPNQRALTQEALIRYRIKQLHGRDEAANSAKSTETQLGGTGEDGVLTTEESAAVEAALGIKATESPNTQQPAADEFEGQPMPRAEATAAGKNEGEKAPAEATNADVLGPPIPPGISATRTLNERLTDALQQTGGDIDAANLDAVYDAWVLEFPEEAVKQAGEPRIKEALERAGKVPSHTQEGEAVDATVSVEEPPLTPREQQMQQEITQLRGQVEALTAEVKAFREAMQQLTNASGLGEILKNIPALQALIKTNQEQAKTEEEKNKWGLLALLMFFMSSISGINSIVESKPLPA